MILIVAAFAKVYVEGFIGIVSPRHHRCNNNHNHHHDHDQILITTEPMRRQHLATISATPPIPDSVLSLLPSKKYRRTFVLSARDVDGDSDGDSDDDGDNDHRKIMVVFDKDGTYCMSFLRWSYRLIT